MLLSIILIATVVTLAKGSTTINNCKHNYSAKEIDKYAGQIWDHSIWERGDPRRAAVRGYKVRLACAKGLGHKQAGKRSWRAHKRSYYHHRAAQLFRVRVTPFYCTNSYMTFEGGWYAIPCYNVNQESGGRGGWTCNTYGIIDEIWTLYGGGTYAYNACSASEKDQSRIAHKIYQEHGSSAWTPFEY